jgi:folate-binding protein YgfZ
MTAITPRADQEYWAARRGAGLIDRSGLGRLKMTGADALDLLHRLSTQDLLRLKPGHGTATVLTSDKGRIIDLLTVWHVPDHLLLLTSAGNQGAVLAWIDRYTITEDAQTADVTSGTGLLYLFGPNAVQVAGALAGKDVRGLPLFHHTPVIVGGMPATLARAPAIAGDGFHLLVAHGAQTAAVRAALLTLGAAHGLVETSHDAFEMLRIEAGQPAFGCELDERFNPLEAGLRPHISFDKGCYIGQEVVARLDTYDKVQRALVGLLMPGESPPEPGTALRLAGREVGLVTSAARSPALGRAIALAYVRGAHAQPGTRLEAATATGPAEAEVAALPFRV